MAELLEFLPLVSVGKLSWPSANLECVQRFAGWMRDWSRIEIQI